MVDAAVMRRVETVIHAGRQPQGDKTSVAVRIDQRGVAEQVEQRVPGALDLKQFGIGDRTKGADDRIAGADHNRGIEIGWTQAGAKLARKTIMQAFEMCLPPFDQIKLR